MDKIIELDIEKIMNEFIQNHPKDSMKDLEYIADVVLAAAYKDEDSSDVR